MAREMRKIVKIDEEKCNGCGQCVPACAEGAIQVIDGKARLISEVYCDGLGACLGECPQDAITIEQRPAEAFDEKAVQAHLAAAGPAERAAPASAAGGGCPGAALRELRAGGGGAGGCPGSAMRNLTEAPTEAPGPADEAMPASQLGHWPIQLRLIPPTAPFLQGADIVICADCVPFVVPDFHARYLTGRAVLIGCPKLDDIDAYHAKFRQIFATARPASLTVLRMEVPCCSALAAAVEARNTVAPTLPTEVHVLGIRGGVERQVIPTGP